MKLLFESGYLFLLGRLLAGRIGVCLGMALLSKVALLFAFTAFFSVGRALFGTEFASASFAVVLIFGASITGSLGLFAEGLLLLSELLCAFSFSQVVVPPNLFHFGYVRLTLFLSSGGVENTAGVYIFSSA